MYILYVYTVCIYCMCMCNGQQFNKWYFLCTVRMAIHPIIMEIPMNG